MPSADFCGAVRQPHDRLSPLRDTPQISRGKFDRLPRNPPDLQRRPLVDMDFAISRLLVRPRLPRIRFLFVGSRFCYRFLQTAPRGDALASR